MDSVDTPHSSTQLTPVEIDGHPFQIRHPPLASNRHLPSLHSFLAKVDYLATAPDSPAFPPTKQNLSHSPEIAVQIIKSLYSFAFEPEWSHHFFPLNAYHPLNTPSSSRTQSNPNDIPILSLPDITSTFTLTSLQGEEAIEYTENRRGKPCGHVFQKGEGVYHCRLTSSPISPLQEIVVRKMTDWMPMFQSYETTVIAASTPLVPYVLDAS
jgi:E3 ubiquitin-protein ligase UBR1